MINVTTIPADIKAVLYLCIEKNDQNEIVRKANKVSEISTGIASCKDTRLLGVYMDYADMPSAADRDGFLKMITDFRRLSINRVYIDSIYSLGHSGADAMRAARCLLRYRIGIFVVDIDESLPNPDHPAVIERYYSFEGEEEKKKRERKQARTQSVINKLEDGTSGYLSRACYGYRSGENNKLVISEPEAEIVRTIFEQFIAGTSMRRILSDLENRGIASPTGKSKWYVRTIANILDNFKYTGAIIVSDLCITGHHDPIISEDDYNKVRFIRGLSEIKMKDSK